MILIDIDMIFGKGKKGDKKKDNNKKDNKKNDNNNDISHNKNIIINPGEKFDLKIPIPNTTNEIVINYNDKYGNLYETRGIIKDGNIKNTTRIILHAPFRSRFRSIVISELILCIIGIISYFLTKSYIAIIAGLGVYNTLIITTEIYFKIVNNRFNGKNIKNVIEIVKEK